jgi:hypothetical protein
VKIYTVNLNTYIRWALHPLCMLLLSLLNSWGFFFLTGLHCFPQVFPEIILPRLLTRIETTFTAWNRDKAPLEFAFDTRPSVESVCEKPYLFYLEDMQIDPSTSRVVSVYKRLKSVDEEKSKNRCWLKGLPPSQVESIRVVSERASDKFFSVRLICFVQYPSFLC